MGEASPQHIDTFVHLGDKILLRFFFCLAPVYAIFSCFNDSHQINENKDRRLEKSVA